MKVRNKGAWPLAYFDDEAGRIDLPIDEEVEVPDRIGKTLVKSSDIMRVAVTVKGE